MAEMSSVVRIPAAAILGTSVARNAAKEMGRGCGGLWRRRGAAKPHRDRTLLIDGETAPAAHFAKAIVDCEDQSGSGCRTHGGFVHAPRAQKQNVEEKGGFVKLFVSTSPLS